MRFEVLQRFEGMEHNEVDICVENVTQRVRHKNFGRYQLQKIGFAAVAVLHSHLIMVAVTIRTAPIYIKSAARSFGNLRYECFTTIGE